MQTRLVHLQYQRNDFNNFYFLIVKGLSQKLTPTDGE